jgi:DNA-binding response OmpR family regulator
VLDLMLPGLDGVEVCRRLRELRPALPILILTARGSETDKVNGLDAGADDYVTKPFSIREMVARVKALCRRSGLLDSAMPATIDIDGCRIDLGRCTAAREDGSSTSLTAREVRIVQLLHEQRRRAVPRSELLEVVWGARGDLRTRTVDMTIANLRQKIERDPTRPRIIVTVTGVGYAWGDP